MSDAWYGVDFDGTLVEQGGLNEGKPVPAMIDRVKEWLAEGRNVRIVTARARGGTSQIEWIEKFCLHFFGRILPITDRKDFDMIELWDDRVVQVQLNTGQRIGEASIPDFATEAMSMWHLAVEMNADGDEIHLQERLRDRQGTEALLHELTMHPDRRVRLVAGAIGMRIGYWIPT